MHPHWTKVAITLHFNSVYGNNTLINTVKSVQPSEKKHPNGHSKPAQRSVTQTNQLFLNHFLSHVQITGLFLYKLSCIKNNSY